MNAQDPTDNKNIGIDVAKHGDDKAVAVHASKVERDGKTEIIIDKIETLHSISPVSEGGERGPVRRIKEAPTKC